TFVPTVSETRSSGSVVPSAALVPQ
ncbi:hypothetical protein Tco_0590046, partial [Tanacetum coccineum]